MLIWCRWPLKHLWSLLICWNQSTLCAVILWLSFVWGFISKASPAFPKCTKFWKILFNDPWSPSIFIWSHVYKSDTVHPKHKSSVTLLSVSISQGCLQAFSFLCCCSSIPCFCPFDSQTPPTPHLKSTIWGHTHTHTHIHCWPNPLG